jgi:SecD/SecF fusion protein
MKTYFIIVAIIFVAFSFAGCTTKENFDFKATVVPQTYNSVASPGDWNKSAEVINKRLNYFFSIPENRIKLDVNENKILLTISKIDTSKIDLIKNVITGYARLEFRETYENGEIIGYLSKANNMLRDMQTAAAGADIVKTAKTQAPADTIKIEDQALLELIKRDTVKTADDTAREEFANQNPLFGILSPMVTAGGEPLPSCMIGLASGKDTSEINKYFKMDQIRALFPADLKFYWSANPYRYDPSKSLYELHAIKVTAGNEQAPLDGSAIISAKLTSGSARSEVKIDLMMDSEGAKTWAGITRENINRCIAIVLNGYVRSYPRVMSEISGGKTEITGDFTFEEANDLVNILKSGKLPFELKIVEAQIIKRE